MEPIITDHLIYGGFKIQRVLGVSQTMVDANMNPVRNKKPTFMVVNTNGDRLGFDHQRLLCAKRFIENSLKFEGNRFKS